MPSFHQRSLVTPVLANIPTNDNEQYVEQVVECPTDNDIHSDDGSSFFSTDSLAMDDGSIDSYSVYEDDIGGPPSINTAPSNNIIINLPSLLCSMNNATTCGHCKNADMNSFFAYCNAKVEEMYTDSGHRFSTNKCRLSYTKQRSNVRQWFREWQECNKQNNLEHNLTLKDTTYDLASNLEIICNRCGSISGVEGKKSREHNNTNSDLCKYEINLRFCMALQLMGVGGEHAAVLSSFLDLPESWKWQQNFTLLEKYTHDAMQLIKTASQHKAVEEEVLETLGDKEHTVEQSQL